MLLETFRTAWHSTYQLLILLRNSPTLFFKLQLAVVNFVGNDLVSVLSQIKFGYSPTC